MKAPKLIKKRWYVFLAVLVILFFVYRQFVVLPKKKLEGKSYRVRRQNIKEVLSLSGEVAAEESVALRFQTSGRLAWVGVKEGDYVRKYQAIASLDQRDLKNRLNKYLRDYAKERNDFEEASDVTYPSGAVTNTIKRILENNQYDLDKTVLDVEYQNLAIEYSNLWTPIEGIVTHIDTPYPGVNITPAGAEFDIVNPKTIYFSVTADQTDVVNLKVGDQGEVVFDPFPNKTYTGKINYIAYSPKTDETGTVYEIHIKLDEKVMKLPIKIGMTGDVDFLVKEKNNVLSVPSGYINSDKKGDYVYVKLNGKKVKRYIKISEEINGQTIIINGITAGEVVYD